MSSHHRWPAVQGCRPECALAAHSPHGVPGARQSLPHQFPVAPLLRSRQHWLAKMHALPHLVCASGQPSAKGQSRTTDTLQHQQTRPRCCLATNGAGQLAADIAGALAAHSPSWLAVRRRRAVIPPHRTEPCARCTCPRTSGQRCQNCRRQGPGNMYRVLSTWPCRMFGWAGHSSSTVLCHQRRSCHTSAPPSHRLCSTGWRDQCLGSGCT